MYGWRLVPYRKKHLEQEGQERGVEEVEGDEWRAGMSLGALL